LPGELAVLEHRDVVAVTEARVNAMIGATQPDGKE